MEARYEGAGLPVRASKVPISLFRASFIWASSFTTFFTSGMTDRNTFLDSAFNDECLWYPVLECRYRSPVHIISRMAAPIDKLFRPFSNLSASELKPSILNQGNSIAALAPPATVTNEGFSCRGGVTPPFPFFLAGG